MMPVRRMGRALLLIFVLGSTTAAFAQGRADIVGRVTDASGAVLPAVTVTAENMATNIVSTTVSTDTGDYLFTALPIGTYTVKIELDGFQSKSTRVTLTTGERVRVDAALEVGTLSETVQVTGQAAVLQTDSSRVASLVNEKMVQDAPIQGRNIINFIQLTPGASEGNANATTSGNRPDDRRQTSAVSIGGAAENDNSQLIDGMDNTERVQGGMGIKPSIDAIAEVLVQTNNYSAENGRTLAGVINIITKSGGNRFSGSAFEFTRHERFDARNFFATGGEKPQNRLHQFGGSLGGPIKTNRTFFFVDYDQNRIRKGVTFVVTVPTMKMRAGDFSEIPAVIYDPLTTPRTPFPGNQIPVSRIDPIAAKLFSLYPAPTAPGLANNFSMVNESWQTNHTADARVDHRFSNNDSIFARYSYNTTTGLTPSMCPVADFQGRKIDPTCNTQGTQGIYSGPYLSYAHNAIASWVHIFNPTLISEVKFNFVRPLTTAERPSANDADLGQFLGLQNINYPDDPITAGMPWFEPRPLSYAAIGDPTFIPMTTENHNYQFAGSVTKTFGAHNFKIGGGLVYRQFGVQQSQSPRSMFAFDVAPTRSSAGVGGDTWASWLLGYPSVIQRTHFPIHPENRTNEPSFYVQDDWRATSWLTVNLGLRYEVFTPTTEVEDRMSAFNPDAGRILVAGRDTTRTGGVRTDYSDIGPRVGFAATLPHNMVLRSGFGMTYNPVLRGAGSFLKNPPFTQNFGPTNSAAASGGLPDITLRTPVPPLTWNSELTPAGQVQQPDPNYKATRAKQFNAVLEKEISGNVVSIGYIGLRGDRINQNQNINMPALGSSAGVQGRRPYFARYPLLTNINMIRNLGERTYNAMQVVLQRRYSAGLTFNTHYTLANGRSLTLMPWDNTQLEWGDTPTYDIRHKWVGTMSYELPWGRNLQGAAHGFLSGWQTNVVAFWQTGMAFSVTNATQRTNVGGADRPNLIGDPDLPSGERTLQRYFNTAAFELQPQLTAGNAPVGLLHGPPQRRLDFSIFKTLEMRSNNRLQIRIEVYNVTNTANFQPPDGSFGGATFGSISSTGNSIPRQMQFGIKYLF
jgi:Carboxypeptidase regulatory-like domain